MKEVEEEEGDGMMEGLQDGRSCGTTGADVVFFIIIFTSWRRAGRCHASVTLCWLRPLSSSSTLLVATPISEGGPDFGQAAFTAFRSGPQLPVPGPWFLVQAPLTYLNPSRLYFIGRVP